MKKRIAIVLALSLLLALAMAGCGSKPKDAAPAAVPTNEPAAQASAAPAPTATPEPTPEPPPSFSIANLQVAIGGAEWVTLSGEDALCVYLDFTNTSDMIIQPSNEISFDALQNGEDLERPRGETPEQRALIENQHRRLFPGAVNRAAVYYLPADDAAEITINFEGRKEEFSEAVALDPASLWEIAPPPANPPATELAAIQGYSGTKAHFDSDFSTLAEGDLELLRHEFTEVEGNKYVVVYFGVEVTGNMEKGESKDPYLMTNCFAFQDGMQLGSSTTQDDRMSYGVNVYTMYELFPEVEAHMKNIGPNEPVTTAIIYRLISDADVSVAAAFNCSDFTEGEAFIGDTFPVE